MTGEQSSLRHGERVAASARRMGYEVLLIGGAALAAHHYVRMTYMMWIWRGTCRCRP